MENAWEQRREGVRQRAEAAAAARQRDAAAAQVLIDGFVASATAAGLPAQPLRAQLTSGGTARTGRDGWYVNAAGSLAVGTNGAWYCLVVPGGMRERLRGIGLAPSEPSLRVAAGGRDGESGDLKDFLDRRLAAG